MEGGIIEVAFSTGFSPTLILAVLFGTSIGVLVVGSFFLDQDREKNVLIFVLCLHIKSVLITIHLFITHLYQNVYVIHFL